MVGLCCFSFQRRNWYSLTTEPGLAPVYLLLAAYRGQFSPSDVAGIGEESHEKAAAFPAVSAGIALQGREEMPLCFGEQAPLKADRKEQPFGVSTSLVSSGVTVLAACCVAGRASEREELGSRSRKVRVSTLAQPLTR